MKTSTMKRVIETLLSMGVENFSVRKNKSYSNSTERRIEYYVTDPQAKMTINVWSDDRLTMTQTTEKDI